MAQISHVGLGATANAESPPVLASKKELQPDDFIKLFLTQMRSQNPLNPTDSNAILQQMAEISSISASKSMENSMATLSQNVAVTMGNSQVLEATQLIGKKVEVPTPNGVTPLVENDGLAGSVLLPAPASDLKIIIKDPSGNTVKTIDMGASGSSGLVDFKWDGKGDDGTVYKPDYYQVTASAVIDGKSVNVHTAGSYKVNSVALNQKTGGVILNVEGLGGIGMGDIVKIL